MTEAWTDAPTSYAGYGAIAARFGRAYAASLQPGYYGNRWDADAAAAAYERAVADHAPPAPKKPRRACSEQGCVAKHHARGLCQEHYHQRKRRDAPAPPPAYRTCDLPGCDRRHEARGLCKTHYNRAHAEGTLPPKQGHQRKTSARTCDRPHCDRPHRARGLCNMHYDRIRRKTPENRRRLAAAQRRYYQKQKLAAKEKTA